MFNTYKKEDEKARTAIKRLCNVLGISLTFDALVTGEVELGHYSYHDGGDPKRNPIKKEEFEKVQSEILEKIDAIAQYLQIEWHEQEKVAGYRKIKNKK